MEKTDWIIILSVFCCAQNFLNSNAKIFSLSLTSVLPNNKGNADKLFPVLPFGVAEKANKTKRRYPKMKQRTKEHESGTRYKNFDFNVLKEQITPNNVFAMSEVIALTETRSLIAFMGTRMQKINVVLFVDIKNRNDINRVLSDGYELVQECAVYLCEHYGQHLDDVIGYTKKGKKITVRIACIKKMMKLINRRSSDAYRTFSLESLTRNNEPAVEMKEEVKQDYEKCDKIVESLNLTDNMRVALECRMAGLSYPEIGRILERAQATVYEYFVKMRQRYQAIYG